MILLFILIILFRFQDVERLKPHITHALADAPVLVVASGWANEAIIPSWSAANNNIIIKFSADGDVEAAVAALVQAAANAAIAEPQLEAACVRNADHVGSVVAGVSHRAWRPRRAGERARRVDAFVRIDGRIGDCG